MINAVITAETSNFGFLAGHDPVLLRMAVQAERYFPEDPTTSLIKLRQFGEILAQQVTARAGIFTSPEEPQADLLRRIRLETGYSGEVIDLFHDLRRAGNEAVHRHHGDHATALTCLKPARQLGIWFHRTYGGDHHFRLGSFLPPRPPADPTAALRQEFDRLMAKRNASLSAADCAREAAAAAEAARQSAEDQARAAAEERAFREEYAAETEAAKEAALARLASLQEAAAAALIAMQLATAEAAQQAAAAINLDEVATRVLIDARLRARGWETDSQALGVRSPSVTDGLLSRRSRGMPYGTASPRQRHEHGSRPSTNPILEKYPSRSSRGGSGRAGRR